MSDINSKAEAILTFARNLSDKLDANPAFDQVYNCITINALIGHKALVECEKQIDAFGLLDTNKVSGAVVQAAVKDYLGEDIVSAVPETQRVLDLNLNSYTNENADWSVDDSKELKKLLKEEGLQSIMSPTSTYTRGVPSMWTVLRELHDTCQYLTADKKYCHVTDEVRTEVRKDSRRKFKRTKFFEKMTEGSKGFVMNDAGIEEFFGKKHPYLSKFAGTDVQVTWVTVNSFEGSYKTVLTFADGNERTLFHQSTLTDVAENLVRGTMSHYEFIEAAAEANAKKGLPPASGYPDYTDETHKTKVLNLLNFEMPEELEYQVYEDVNAWTTYVVRPAGMSVDGCVSVSVPTNFFLAEELCEAKNGDKKVREEKERVQDTIKGIARKLLQLKQRLAELEVSTFDSKSAIEKAQENIAQ